MTGMLAGSLTVETTDRVTFVFTVTNTADDPVTVTFRDACLAEFVVRDDDAERWRFSEGRMFAQRLEERTLDPGEELPVRAVWDSPAPGSYSVEASLNASTDCRDATSFSYSN